VHSPKCQFSLFSSYRGKERNTCFHWNAGSRLSKWRIGDLVGILPRTLLCLACSHYYNKLHGLWGCNEWHSHTNGEHLCKLSFSEHYCPLLVFSNIVVDQQHGDSQSHTFNSREYLSGKSFCLATYGKVVTRPLFKKDHHYSQSKKKKCSGFVITTFFLLSNQLRSFMWSRWHNILSFCWLNQYQLF